jgi:hypothetical protein
MFVVQSTEVAFAPCAARQQMGLMLGATANTVSPTANAVGVFHRLKTQKPMLVLMQLKKTFLQGQNDF